MTLAIAGAGLIQGTLGALALAALYKSLALGPIAIVSPIVAAYAAITVLLAVVILGEALSATQTLAIVATLGGIVLASTDLRVVRQTLGRPTPGIALALLSMVIFGVLTFLLAAFTRSLGLFATVLYGRTAAALTLAAAGAIRRERISLARPALALLAVVGILDLAATLSFGLGALAGYASIVAIGASAYPLIPLALGLGVLRERVAPNQFVGVALLVGGLMTLGATG